MTIVRFVLWERPVRFRLHKRKNNSNLRLTFLDYHDKVVLALDGLEC